MTRVAVIVIALVAACSCAIDDERRLASTFDASRTAVRRGELAEARALAERGVAAARPDSEWSWTFRLFRGDILLLQHQPAEVVPLVAAVLPAGATFDEARARQKFLEARLQLSRNQIAEAIATLESARRLAPGARDLQFDIAWMDGQLRLRLGRWSEAESKLNDFIAQAAAAGDRFQQARALNDLGMGSVVRGRWDEALPRFERVLAFEGIESLTVYAAALSNAGMCYSRLGEFDRALEVQRRSVSLHTGRGPRADFAQALAGLGNTFIMKGESREALPFIRQALSVATESNLESDAALWAGNLAAANVELGEWNDAERFNEDAKRLKTASRTGSLVHNTLNAAQIAQGRGRIADATRLFEEALAGAGSAPDVRWSAHAGLAGLAVAAARPDWAARHFEAALDTIEKTRSELLKTEYKLSFLTRLIQFYQAYVDALIDQGRVERALEITESSRGRVLGERNGLAPPAKASASALQQIAARSRSVLLSYWLGRARSYVWVVNAAGIQVRRLPPADEIGALVRQYQATVNNAMADPLASPGTAGDRLYQILVEPVLPSIPAGTRVVIAADGALHGINFETLPVPGGRRHYWIEDVEIETTPALSMLSAAPPLPRRAPSLLLFGDPAPRPPEFPRLRYAAAEITNVSKNFPADAVATYKGDRASPAAYKAATPDRFTFVHFTAHAAANLQSPLDSAVILAGPDAAYKLYARDVAELPLRADLVTVSACRSAGERAYSGEGLVGFAWAFLRAGARNVIAGLWDVDDRSTARLMDGLYGGLGDNHAPARALREAKLDLIKQGGQLARPYYWGPFQLFTVAP
jgi:CHAT domain-containing protein/tetratricopeptide (TPR) repeat protein